MSIDLNLLFLTLISFALYLVLQIVIFRFVARTDIVKWVIYTYLLGAISNIVICLTRFGTNGLEFVLISFINYSLITAVYILGIFGMVESALRIRLVTEVDRRSSGISKSQVLKIYNRKLIVEKRLARFLKSGDLKYNRGYYFIGKKVSYFFFHSLIIDLIGKFYK